jgi:hypothetical protein
LLEANYNTLVQKIALTEKHQTSWHVLHGEVHQAITKRNELRKTYDHYDQKLEKNLKTRNNKFENDLPESQEDLNYFERVYFG